MKRVKMIALGMAVIVGGLTACGSAKEATTCKTAYAENGQYYVYAVSYTHLDVYKRQAEWIREDG